MDPCQCMHGRAVSLWLCQARGEKYKQNSLSSRIRIQISRVVDRSRCRHRRERTHQKITHSARERGGEREADWRATNAVQEAAVCAVAGCLCGVRGSCASSSCHTWSPNYVASRGLNTHTHTHTHGARGSSSRLLPAARSFPSKKPTEREGGRELIKVCLPVPAQSVPPRMCVGYKAPTCLRLQITGHDRIIATSPETY